MIHHEKISAETASESGEAGHFDVIEESDGFNVYDCGAGLYLSNHGTLEDAIASATEEAKQYDLRSVPPPVAPPRFDVTAEVVINLGANDAEHAKTLVNRYFQVNLGECQQLKSIKLTVTPCP
jgi:GH24 family phage-related lysozyme (muramidase)